MSHALRPVRAPRILAGILSLIAATIPAAAEIVSLPVIRIYDGGATDTRTRADAISTAATIVANGGVDAMWNDCTPDEGTRRCSMIRGPRDLMIRILPAAPAAAPRQPVGAPGGAAMLHGTTLGSAVVKSESGSGVLGTIFMDRVRTTAKRTGIAPAVLLGRAIAHEAGHLLLGRSGHARSGLMREVWTDGELTQNRPEDWLFTAGEQQLLQRTGVIRAASSGRHPAGEIAPPAAAVRDVESTR